MKKRIRDFLVLIEQSPDGWFVAKVPTIQGCYTQGKTVEQTIQRVKEAIRVCLEADKIELPQWDKLNYQEKNMKS